MDRAAPGMTLESESAESAEVAWESTAGASSSDLDWEIHDRRQLELRFRYGLGRERTDGGYTIDAWLFVPRSLGVTKDTYTKQDFYGDVTAYIRLDARPLPLQKLADSESAASPLYHFHRDLERYRNDPIPPPAGPVLAHAKLYAFLFVGGIRREFRKLRRMLRPQVWEGKTSHERWEKRLESVLGGARHGLAAFRRLRSGFWPFAWMTDSSLENAMRSADEYMSLELEEQISRVVAALQAPHLLDGSGFALRNRLRLTKLATEEAEYRTRYGYLVLTGDDETRGEYFTHRMSLLKKTVQQALYLDVRSVKRDPFIRNAVGAFGAAVAATWALATQLPVTLANMQPNTQRILLAFAVLAYVAKDRIKAITNEYIAPRLLRYDHTSRLQGAALEAMGFGRIEAKLREANRFRTPGEIPADVLRLRQKGRTVLHLESAGEEVIHYRKQLVQLGSQRRAYSAKGYSLRDILRLNVRHFIARADDPYSEVGCFDPGKGTFSVAKLPKVYHLNLVLEVRSRQGAQDLRRLEHLRIVVNQEGILRIEHAGQQRAVLVAPEQSRASRIWARLRRAFGGTGGETAA